MRDWTASLNLEFVGDCGVIAKDQAKIVVQLGLAFLDVLLFAPDCHSFSFVNRFHNDIGSVLEGSPFSRGEVKLC